jgi:hypothetical protein
MTITLNSIVRGSLWILRFMRLIRDIWVIRVIWVTIVFRVTGFIELFIRGLGIRFIRL